MPSITSWTRLEPRVRRDDPGDGLAARVHDPLWLLARQWQVGEMVGEDIGSPMRVQIRLDRSPLTRYATGGAFDDATGGVPYDPATVPLEVLVEQEDASTDLRRAFDAGLKLLRLLARHGVATYADAFSTSHPLGIDGAPAPTDPKTARLLRMSNGRVPDGLAVAAAVRAAPDRLPPTPDIDDDDRTDVGAVVAELVEWLDGRADRPAASGGSSWDPTRMEHRFAVAGPAGDGEHVLIADEYAQGHLDWHAFDRAGGRTLGADADATAHEVLTCAAIPAPVTYRGMPVARWWEFEDGQVNLAAVDAGPTDLLRVLFLGFALDYGNDWFVAPVELPGDSVYEVQSVVVTDSFGVQTLVRPYTRARPEGSRWRIFDLSEEGTGRPDAHLLFVPPSLPAVLASEPLEEVLLVRDEIANLAWGVERRVEDPGGRPVDRSGDPARANATNGDATVGDDLRYRLATTVPDHWIPLVATRPDPAGPDIRLVRGRVLLDGGATPVAPTPRGALLEPGRPLRIHEEEIGRHGAQLTRRVQHTRWVDGGRHMWTGRRKRVGRGEGASGLRFDTANEAT